MAFGFKSFIKGIRLVPVSSTNISVKGDLEVLDASGKLNYFNGTSASPLVTEAHAATLTNKIISGAANTITNIGYSSLTLTNSIVNADINTSAAIAYSKLNLVGSIVNADIAIAANIARSKLASSSINHVIINDGSGVLSSEAQLSITRGGTGQATQTAAFDALSPNTTKGDIIVYNGTDNIRVPVGTNSQVLTANSAQVSGVEWTNSAVADNSITEFKLTTSVAGNGLLGGNGTPLTVNVDNETITINTDTLSTNVITVRYNSNGSAQTFGTAAFLIMPGSEFDTGSGVTSTSPFIYTIPFDGYYEVYAQLDFQSDSWNNGTSSFVLQVEKNAGATVSSGTILGVKAGALLSSSGPIHRYWVNVHTLNFFSVGDTIKVSGIPATSFNPISSGLTERCFIYIKKVN